MIDKNTFGSKTALFHTFGCKLNFAETSTVARLFASRGIQRVHEGDVPDYIVVNTCSVTEIADKKCRQAIRSFARRYPDARIIVTGCYAQLKPDEVKGLPGVAVVAGTDRKLELADYLDRLLSADWDGAESTYITPTKDIRKFSPSCSRGDRTRYFLKVQDGCDYYCSYCTIPMARGRSRSGRIADIVAQAREVAAEGGREIVITGVNIGDFGHGSDHDFLDLLKELDAVEGIERYRISSIEPNLLTDDMIEWVARSRTFMPHFHIPLQSGSDAVLQLMRRRYDTALFAHKIARIREVMPDAFIGVDLIVGAKGETLEEFEKSKAFVDGLDITRLHIFPYSERPGTRAVAETEWVRVDQAEKHRRAAEMQVVSDSKLHAFIDKNCGHRRPVLVEHTAHNGHMYGFTDNYLRVELPLRPELYNEIIDVDLSKPKAEGSTDIIGVI